MKWEGNRQSDNVEDRRNDGGDGGGRRPMIGGRGIGLGTIVIPALQANERRPVRDPPAHLRERRGGRERPESRFISNYGWRAHVCGVCRTYQLSPLRGSRLPNRYTNTAVSLSLRFYENAHGK